MDVGVANYYISQRLNLYAMVLQPTAEADNNYQIVLITCTYFRDMRAGCMVEPWESLVQAVGLETLVTSDIRTKPLQCM